MQRTDTYRIKGMHCASCAITIEKALKKTDGVKDAQVNYGTETAKVTFDDDATGHLAMAKEVETLGYQLQQPEQTAADMGMTSDEHAAHTGIGQSKADKIKEIAEMRSKITVALPLAAASAAMMLWDGAAQLGLVPEMNAVTKTFVHHLLPIFATYVLFVTGLPYLKGLVRFLRHGRANMDTLIGLGTVAAFLYSFAISAFENVLRPYVNVEQSYYDVTIVVIAFVALGKYLEARSKLKTGDAIEKLLMLQSKNATVLRGGAAAEIPVAQVVHGDLVLVKPAGRIPVDGTVTEGSSYVDESVVTGEPMPVRKQPGDAVVSGTLNGDGALTFTATKVGAETMLSRIIKMVEEAQGSRAPIQALADRISAVFVPTVLVIAALSLAAWLLLGSGPLGFSKALSIGLSCFVGVLVIACPCALGLATPTAIIVGVGKGAASGILIKDAATLERLHEADTVVMDKTGTLTRGKPEVTAVLPANGVNSHDLLTLLGSLEALSEHPLARAVIAKMQAEGLTASPVTEFQAIKGQGLQGMVDGRHLFAGNARLMQANGVRIDAEAMAKETAQGRTPIMLAQGQKLLGTVLVADALKPESVEAVKALHAMGIRTVMLTGDDAQTAAFIAKQAGIDDVVAEVLPEDKLRVIKELQAKGRTVAMAGDGVNDAPALAQADVGVAMATGTDVAIESAGITLLHGDLSRLVKAVRLSKLTMRGIRQNLFWAFAYNVVGIPLAAGVFWLFGGPLLNPAFAGLAMALSSVSVVGNSLRLKGVKL